MQLMDVALSSSGRDFPCSGDEASDDEDALLVSRLRYDHYELQTTPEGNPWELGRGAMGITYLATDTRLGRRVALKIINTSQFTGKNGRDRLLREARAIARLRHPGIASIHHLGEGEENCFFAMEYIEGETLEACVQRDGALACEWALNITTQAARALNAAHEQGFIHRDIKPTNLMLITHEHGGEPETQVKLIDFGLVKAIAAEETASDSFSQAYFAGTPHYASPEQRVGERVDNRSDIYSLGMCLRFMLTGTSLADLPTQMPADVLVLLDSMVAADPDFRPQSAGELLRRLEHCLRDHSSNDITKRSPSHHPWPHRPALLMIALLAAILVILLGVNRLPVKYSFMSRKPSQNHVDAQVFTARAKDAFDKHTKAGAQEAVDLYLEAVKRDPELADAHAGLAFAYFRATSQYNSPVGEIPLAIASAERAIALDPRSPKGYTALAAIRSWQGKHWDALDLLHHALEIDPKYTPAMRAFSLLWCSVGQTHKALPWAIAATQLEPSSHLGWDTVCEVAADLCDDERVEEDCRRGLQINPAWMRSHFGLVHLHLLQGNFAQARQDYAVANSFESDTLIMLTLKAQIEFFGGDYLASEATYRRLIQVHRGGYVNFYGGISYLSALGYLRQRAGDVAEANALLEEAANLHKEEFEGSQATYDLAAIRAIQGRKEDALVLLQQAITAGWMDFRSTKLDPRFEGLRDEPRFQTLLNNLSGRVARRRQQAEVLCAKALNIADYPVQPSQD